MNAYLNRDKFKIIIKQGRFHTQQDLAKRIGVRPSTISKWLSDKNQQPITKNHLRLLSEALNVEEEWLIGDFEIREYQPLTLEDIGEEPEPLTIWEEKRLLEHHKLVDASITLQELVHKNEVEIKDIIIKATKIMRFHERKSRIEREQKQKIAQEKLERGEI